MRSAEVRYMAPRSPVLFESPISYQPRRLPTFGFGEREPFRPARLRFAPREKCSADLSAFLIIPFRLREKWSDKRIP